MKYIYETHLHTCEGSRCGMVNGKDYVDYLIGKGYSGMIVTDHFFNGNCAIDPSLPWETKVEAYCQGYREALKAAEGKDFNVMFGVEYNFEGDEYLLYGISLEWLTDHPEIMGMTRHELYKTIKQAGGMMIHAHPYRERDYLVDIKLTEGVFDGLEVYNAANTDNMNALAFEYCKKVGSRMIAGSDIHYYHDRAMGGMAFDHKIDSIEEYVSCVLNGEGVAVQVKDGKGVPVEDISALTNSAAAPSYEVHWMETEV